MYIFHFAAQWCRQMSYIHIYALGFCIARSTVMGNPEPLSVGRVTGTALTLFLYPHIQGVGVEHILMRRRLYGVNRQSE